jgi:hypothetical protein
VAPERVDDLLEQTHEVARSDHDRRLTPDFASLAIAIHFVAMMCAPPMPRIRRAVDWLREERTSTALQA